MTKTLKSIILSTSLLLTSQNIFAMPYESPEVPVAGIEVSLNNYYTNEENAVEKLAEYFEDSTPSYTEPVAVKVKIVTASKAVVSVCGVLNLREAPNTDSAIIAYLSSGEEVSTYETYDGWTRVEYNGITGYLKSDYINTDVSSYQILNNTLATMNCASDCYITPSSNSEIINHISIGDTYLVSEIQNNYAKLTDGVNEIGYVPLYAIDVSQASPTNDIGDVINPEVFQVLNAYQMDLDYTHSIMVERMNCGDWIGAYNASIYLVELYGYYINDTRYVGLNSIANEVEPLRQIAINEMNNLAAIVATIPVPEPETEPVYIPPVVEAPAVPAPPVAQPEPAPIIVPEPPTPAPVAPTPEPVAPAPVVVPDAPSLRQQVVDYALSWVGVCGYIWGGTNLIPGGGVDCSGFTMVVYQRVAGITIPHYSMSQIYSGIAISVEQLIPGDLVCFDRHVGIYIGNGQMVHAASPESGIIVSSIYYNPNKQPIGFRRIIN